MEISLDSGNPIIRFIVSAIDFFVSNNVTVDSGSEKALNEFVDTSTILLFVQLNRRQFSFTNKVDDLPGSGRTLIFTKSEPRPIEWPADEKNILLFPLSEYRGDSLDQLFSKIYNPVIQHAKASGDNGSLLMTSLVNQLSNKMNGFSAVNGSPDSELQYWNQVARTSNELYERKRASAFARALEPVVKELQHMDNVRLSELEDSANTILGLIDDLWKLDDYKYPQDRMDRLLNLSGICFVEAVTKKLKNASIWKEGFTDRDFHLEQALACCNAWFVECHRLTSLFWKNDADHQWQGEPYQSLYVLKLRDRIHQIKTIREVIRLAAQLLPKSKHHLLEPATLFQSFQEMDTTMHNSMTESSIWKSAVAQFNEKVVEVEKEVIDILRPKLDAIVNEPAQLLDVFLEYKELIERPHIKDQLSAECQALAVGLKSWLSKLEASLNDETPIKKSNDDVPETLQEIYATRQLETQVMKILKGIQIFLNDRDESPALVREAQALLNDVKERTNDIFDTWSRNILAGIRDQSLNLSNDSPVVTFDSNKLMRINYDSRFVHFVREVELLSSMGFKIAPQILQNSKTAQDFMQQAKDLEQIAEFHNTIGDSIMPCLKPLMLEAAMAISVLVQEQNVVKWSQADTVSNYIRRLQAAVQRLAGLNQQLTTCHDQIKEKVLKLFDVDLMTEQQKWKDILREIRLIMGTIEAQGFTHLQAWRLYWDHQVYKALEHQYQSHLHKLHFSVPDIQVELDFKKQQLLYRPAMEDIRREYYGRIRKFLSIPLHFKGFMDNPGVNNIFPRMVERQANQFGRVYAESSRLFVELEEFRDRQKLLIAPGLVDLDAYLTRELNEVEEWNTAFQAAKKRREELENLPSDDEKIGCFVVSLGPLYRELEYIHRRFWDALTSSLYVSIYNDCRTVDIFTENGTLLLQNHIDAEVDEANSQFNELLRSTPEMVRVIKRAEEKMKVLTRWTSENVEAYNQMCSQWKVFNDLLDGHKEAIHRQIDSLKSNTQLEIMNLTSHIEQFHQEWLRDRAVDRILQGDNPEGIERCIAMIRNKRSEWNSLMDLKNKLNNKLEKVGEKSVELSVVSEIENDLLQQERVWYLYETFSEGLEEMSNEEWIVFRNKIVKLDDYLETWMQTVSETDESLAVITWLRNQIGTHKAFIPVLKLLRGDTFTDRHWIEALQLAGLPSMSTERILLKHFLQSRKDLMSRHNELKELNARAAGESLVRQALSELEQWEMETRWSLSQHVDSGGAQLCLIKEYKELLNKVGENLSLIQSVKDSAYYQAYSDRVMLWETKMTDLDFYLRHLSQVQIKWLYLEPVFNRGALLKDVARFRRLDADFRFIMSEVQRDNKVTSLLRIANLRPLVTNLLDQVGRCQKSLYEFLEDKRSKFARFYFLGDEDLLDIIGQASSKPAIIQSHLKKLFAGIHSVVFSPNGRQIVAISSLEGEQVALRSPISVDGEVENWLSSLVDESRSTLKSLLLEAIQHRQKGPPSLKDFPSQVLCLSEAVVFTERCEKAIASNGLASLHTDYKNHLSSYTSNQGDTDAVEILKLQSLIMDIIHYIDILDQLIKNQCWSLDDWIWQKQLRFYCQNGITVARMAGTEIECTYEYQGNVAKLVHTPLTDKCYLTLTLAQRMGLGGNPYGPAGTGKTESVKALGSLLGRQVLVFNCDEGLDVKSMGRIFIGLVKSGAWGCFDEFNRLDENTLSTVSTLIQAIQLSLKNKQLTVNLLGSEVQISPHTGIYVTLNPAGKEYGGRQKLPDNLKLLFRPVVMSQPDIELIAEVILYSQGFGTAKILGKKLVEIFRLAQKLLSRQQHYDWGLRALKSVLRTAGDGLRKSLSTANPSDDKSQHEAESLVVVRALNFNTLSKLTRIDSTLFLGLVHDMFPNSINNTDTSHSNLIQIITSCYQEMGLTFLDRQAKKILEVYEQLKQRMGVVIVGPPQTGKSTVCAMLKKVLQHERKVHTHTMNPKAINRVHLLGSIDSATREWTDGVLTKVARVIVEEIDVISWVVCDGDIDPEWIEALNSVLDDNRLLTMASGERIKFGPDVNFIFETHDLTYASPATVSRMGVVYFSEEDIEYQAVVNQWLTKQPSESQEFLKNMVESYFYKVIDWIIKNGEPVLSVSTLNLVRGILSQLSICKTKIQFIYGLLKGSCANMTNSSRDSLANMIITMSQVNAPNSEHPYLCQYDPESDALTNLNCDGFDQLILDDDADNLLVPTSNLHLVSTIIQPWLENKEHVLLVGPEASGKSLLLEHCFKQMRSTRLVTVHCTADTTPQQVLHQLLQNSIIISSSGGQVLCPREATMLVLYLKDLNMVVPDKWGTCQLIAFLEQIINYKGCYDHNSEWLVLDSIQLVCSLNLDHSQGRFQLSPRFTSLIHTVAVAPLHPGELEELARRYLTKALEKEQRAVSPANISKMASFMILFDKEVKSNLISDYAFLTLFTTRHLTNWAQGMARYEIDWTEQKSIIQALAYEACRVYRDKLQSDDHRTKFDALLANLFGQEWKFTASPVGGSVYSTYRSKTRGLVPVQLKDWENRMTKTLQQYARENETLDVELLPELLLPVAYADRVLSSPYRSLLLAGRSGVGRHTVAKLLSVMLGARIFSPNPGKNYNKKQFANDLKVAMQAAGVDGDSVYFVLEDYHFIDPVFFAMMDSLLASGEVTGLYSNEEIDVLLSPLKDVAAQEGHRSSLLSFFAQRVRRNFHAIFIMDNTRSNFENLIETHPALYKYSINICMDNWTTKSMALVANRIVQQEIQQVQGELGEILNHSIEIFGLLDKSFQSPRSYVSFIHLFAKIVNMKRNLIAEQKQRIQIGVTKLSEARKQVNQLQLEASEQEKLLEQKQLEAKSALQKITDTIKSASVKRGEMQDLRSTIAEENLALIERKKGIDQEMAEIEPLLAEARAAVSDIRSEALAEIRSLRAPPDTIRDILEGVLRLMGILDTSWTSMKSFLAKRGVKEEIRSFDAKKITAENRRAVEQLLVKRQESFDPRTAKRASAAAAPLAAWVQANVRYSQVLERIAPLEQEQAALQKNLQDAEESMTRLSTGLDDVDKQVAILREKMAVSTREASEIEIGLKKARQTLSVSQNLVAELEDEFLRWQKQLEELEIDSRNLLVHSLVAAAFVSYLSCVSEDGRKKSLSKWLAALHLEKVDAVFSLKTFLTSEQELMLWRSQGLPSDDLAVENAIAIRQSYLCPHVLDSTGKSIQWLCAHFKSSTVEVTSQAHERFSSILELAIRFGKILIIKDVDWLEPILYPILRRDYVVQGVRKVVRLGDKAVDWNDQFRLFLFSRSMETRLPPECRSLVNTVNFNTTQAGLAEQLVALTVQHENAELEQRKVQLLEQEEELKLQLANLEDKLLQVLGNSQGNILDNKDVLSSLKELKHSSATIGQSLKESLELQSALEKERSAHNELAQYGSRLYFAIRQLSKLNHCYQFSVASFMQLYLRNLQSDHQTTESTPESRKLVRLSLLRRVYTNVCRAVFKSDKMAAALHIVREMQPQLFKANEWEVFSGILVSSNAKIARPVWLDESRVPSLSIIKTHLPQVYDALRLDDMSLWAESGGRVPAKIQQALSPFQQIIAVQCLHPDRLMNALSAFLSKMMGLSELFPAASNVRAIWTETSPTEPILVLLPSDGSGSYDMTCELPELARDVLGSDKLHEIAMGADETENAAALIQSAAENGHWICLKNVHLVSSWLTTLDRLLDEIQVEGGHVDDNFRLWMTSEPVETLPAALLQRSKKIVSEAPQGMKRNLNRTFDSWTVNVKDSAVKQQAIFVLSWFHALAQERRNYVPQGWLKKHEFNESDIKAAFQILEQVTKDGERSGYRWDYMNGLLLNVIYGGRVDNDFDMRILQSYLDLYFSSRTLGKQQASLCPSINIPLSSNIQDYLGIIRRLPDEDDSSYFGFPANIDATVQYNESLYLLSRLKALYQTASIGSVSNPKVMASKLTPIFNLWKSLMQGTLLLSKDKEQTVQPDSRWNPLTAFIYAESRLALQIIQQVHQSLAAVNRALKSNATLHASQLETALDIVNLNTPKCWLSLWDGPEQPEQYLQSLVKRARALSEHWLPASIKNELLTSQVLDLSHLMSPEAFFSVLRQHTAREVKIPMDSLAMKTSWDGKSKSTDIAATIQGLYIQGAVMRSGSGLESCSRDTSSWSPAPPCSLSWTKAEEKWTGSGSVVKVPLYADVERQKLIATLDVPFASGQSDDWYRAGVALSLKD